MDIVWDDDNFIEVVLLAMQEDDGSTEEDEGQIELDEEQVPPPHQWGSGSRIGKAPNIERRRVFYSHLLFNDFWGDLPVYSPSYFKRFFKLPIGLLMRLLQELLHMTTISGRRRMHLGSLGCHLYRKSVRLFDNLHLVFHQLNTTTSTEWHLLQDWNQ